MPSEAPGPLVLIVDDDARNLKLARDVLFADGVRTIAATTGAEALDLATRDRPDVILLDLRLPDMSGFDVLRELGSREATAEIPVVALTALRTDDKSEWLLESGFSGHLEKPISVRDFPRQVREHWRNAAP